MRHLLDQAFKVLVGVRKIERHPKNFKPAEGFDDCYFGNVRLRKRDLVIGTYQIGFREYTGAMNVARDIQNVRDCVVVSSRSSVQCSIIATWAPISGIFWKHMQRNSPVAFRGRTISSSSVSPNSALSARFQVVGAKP